MKYIIAFILLIYCALILSGCQSKLLTVYKIDVQQGNALATEEVDKIKVGMNREQVHFVLGSPLIVDSFHPDRWDYIYLFIPGYGEVERRQLTLIFDRNEVIDIVKQNIVADDTPIKEEDDSNEEREQESETEAESTDEEKEEQEKLEEQAEDLEDILDTNKEPIN